MKQINTIICKKLCLLFQFIDRFVPFFFITFPELEKILLISSLYGTKLTSHIKVKSIFEGCTYSEQQRSNFHHDTQ